MRLCNCSSVTLTYRLLLVCWTRFRCCPASLPPARCRCSCSAHIPSHHCCSCPCTLPHRVTCHWHKADIIICFDGVCCLIDAGACSFRHTDLSDRSTSSHQPGRLAVVICSKIAYMDRYHRKRIIQYRLDQYIKVSHAAGTILSVYLANHRAPKSVLLRPQTPTAPHTAQSWRTAHRLLLVAQHCDFWICIAHRW